MWILVSINTEVGKEKIEAKKKKMKTKEARNIHLSKINDQ